MEYWFYIFSQALYYYKRIAHSLLAKIRSVHQTLNASIVFSLICALPLLRRLKLSTPYFDYLMKHALSYNIAKFGHQKRCITIERVTTSSNGCDCFTCWQDWIFAWGKANLQNSWIKSSNSARLAAKQLVGPNEYFTSFATLFSVNKNV